MSNKIYLDHAAATPVDASVIEVMKPFYSDNFYNPSAVYLDGRAAKKALNKARKDIAHWLGSKPDEVIFTAGATESDNIAISGVMQQYPEGNVVVSAIEHDAVLNTAKKFDYKIAPIKKNGQINLESLKSSIDKNTVLVSLMQANNEIGSIQPISDVFHMIEDIRRERQKSANDTPIFLHSDATQAANYLDLHVNRLGVDLMTLNAGKIYGPKQVGVLYVRGGTALKPTIEGGGQERGLRSGTENVAGAVGMAKALDVAQKMRNEEGKRLLDMRKSAEKRLLNEIEDLEIIGGKKRLPNNICLLLPGLDGERAVMELDEKGIQCSTGSACAALSDESSHVIKALGYSEAEASATIRLTSGRLTDTNDLNQAISAIIKLYKNKRHN